MDGADNNSEYKNGGGLFYESTDFIHNIKKQPDRGKGTGRDFRSGGN